MGWILLALGLAVLTWVLTKNKNKKSIVRHSGQSQLYHAVLIKTRGRGCAEVQTFKGKRFLAASAPSVPLADCSASHCGCRFMHLADRRQEQRRSPFAGGGSNYTLASADRRAGHDRRASAT